MTYVFVATLFLANLGAAFAFVRGRRDARPMRFAALAALLAIVVIVVCAVTYTGAMVMAFDDSALGPRPETRATQLAENIAEVMNLIVYGAAGTVAPLIVTIALLFTRPKPPATQPAA